MPRRKFSKEFKQEAVKLVLEEGLKVPEAARNLGIGASTLQKWVSQRRDEDNPDSVNNSNLENECKRLKKELRIAKMEVEILKKATAFFSKSIL